MIKAAARYLLDLAGIEVARTSTFSNFINTRDIDLVVDVGANLGQFAQKTRVAGYKGEILSIEPSSKVYEALSAAKIKKPWTHKRCAVGATTGKAVLNIPINHTLSSIRQTSEISSRLLGSDTSIVSTEVVQIETLDNILENYTSQSIFLKIDTQGYEREVLLGGIKTLQRCVGVLLELPIEHLYKDVWSFGEALSYMDSIDFVPAQIKTVGMMATDQAAAIEVDCIFRPK
jgi:FkbM family methyltransferase